MPRQPEELPSGGDCNGQINIDYSVIAASGFLAALPAVVLVLLSQKYMVQGLTAGSVKG